MSVAALYIDQNGPYPELIGQLNCWDKERDATLYNGPGPVVAHPPCGPWGALAQFCTLQDPALAIHAVRQVREFGGVLEHPAGSKLWQFCRMAYPGLFADKWGGRTMEIDQVRWGHPARKRTWIYVVGVPLPRKIPARKTPVAVIRPAHNGMGAIHVPKSERHLTPHAFARWLVDLARQV